MHRALLHSRLAVVNRCGLSSTPFQNAHVYFERLMYSAFKIASFHGSTCITAGNNNHNNGGSRKPFWRFFSIEQLMSLAHAIANVECGSSTTAPSVSTPTSAAAGPTSVPGAPQQQPSGLSSSAFSEEELEILKGIYFRSAHSVFPPALRKQLVVATANLLSHLSADDGGAMVKIEEIEDFIVDIFWTVYRIVLLPSTEECGVQALTATVQFVSQLRSFLLQRGMAGNFLGLLLPLMTLSRYYVVLMQRGAASGGGDAPINTQISLLLSQHFMSLMSTFFLTSPFDSVEAIHERLLGGAGQSGASATASAATPASHGAPVDFMKELLPIFAATTAEVVHNVRLVLEESQASVLPPVRCFGPRGSNLRPSTLLEVALLRGDCTAQDDPLPTNASATSGGSAHGGSGARTPHVATPNPQPVQQPSTSMPDVSTITTSMSAVPPTDGVVDEGPVHSTVSAGSAFLDQIMLATSWCSEDDMVRFATLTLANTDMIPLSKLSQLFSGLRQAYNCETGGSYEGLMDILAQYKPPTTATASASIAGIPQGLQEVIEYLMLIIKPGHSTHVQALEEASQLIDKRLEEQLAPPRCTTLTQFPPPHLGGTAIEAQGATPLSPQTTSCSSAAAIAAALPSPHRGGLQLNDTTPLWQDDVAEMSMVDDAALKSTSTTNIAYKATNSIW